MAALQTTEAKITLVPFNERALILCCDISKNKFATFIKIFFSWIGNKNSEIAENLHLPVDLTAKSIEKLELDMWNIV
jgi:hypothetical protein